MPFIKKLQLSMRLGSSTFQSTTSAFDSISSEQATSKEEHMKGIGQYCPASYLVESSLKYKELPMRVMVRNCSWQ
jgi:hypothetical protein